MSYNFNRLPFYYIRHIIAEAGYDVYTAAIVFAAVHAPDALSYIRDDSSAIRVLMALAPEKSYFGIRGGYYGFWS